MSVFLEHYTGLLSGQSRPRFLELRDTGELLRLSAASRGLADPCILCHRRCNVRRFEGETGTCGVGSAPAVSSVFPHFGEERVLVPSLTVFLAGCNLECVYCQNHDISGNPDAGRMVTPAALARHIDGWRGEVRNVNWVGGDPSPSLHYVLSVLEALEPPLPQVWNSNMYSSTEAMSVIVRAFDLFLTDFKYGNDDCARRLSGVSGYWKTVAGNHATVLERGSVIVRHLLLPGHFECCTRPVLEYLSAFGEVPVNVMDQYHPCHRAKEHPGMSRRITPEEHRRAVEFAEGCGLQVV